MCCDLPAKEFELQHDVLTASQGFHWCKPRYCISLTEHQWDGIPELKRVFFSSVLQIIFNLFRAYHHCRHHREKKKDHSTAFFQASKWFGEFKKSGFSKPSWLWEQHTNLARPGVALAVTMWSVRNISGGQGSANPLPFAEGSEKAPVGLYFGSQYVELVFSRMELQPQAQIAAR